MGFGSKKYSGLSWKGIPNLRRVLAIVWESAPGWTLANAVLVVLLGALPLLSLYLMKLIVDSISSAASRSGSAYDHILMLIALAAGLSIITALCRAGSSIVGEIQAAQVSERIQEIMLAKSTDIDLEYYESPSYYNALHIAQRQAPSRPSSIVNGLLRIAQSTVTLATTAALLISLSWALAALIAIAAVPGALVRKVFADKSYQWQRSCAQDERKAWYFNWMLTTDSYAKEVRLLGLGALFIQEYRDLMTRLRKERIGISSRRQASDLGAQTLATAALFGSLALIALKAVQGSITIGDLVMYYGAIQQAQSSFSSFLTAVAGLYEDNLFLSSLYEFIDLKPKITEPLNPKPMPVHIEDGISFEHVTFSYSGSGEHALDDVSLKIRAGQVVALVGENGSGKSTVVKLLCRLYDPAAGRIAIDGIDIRDLRISDLRRQISIIFQDFAKYNLTAEENIRLGDVLCPPGDDRIVQSSKLAGADSAIDGLKQGYNTILGKWFDGGVELSNGEWQKVALARAFLRESQIVILDEPTSSLDAMAEEEVFEKFRHLVQGKTAILISHRLSTIKMADNIYLLKDGRIEEQGTHEELYARGGGYYRLFEAQARHYR